MIKKSEQAEKKDISKIDYNKILGLRFQAKQKLIEFCPQTLGQASRIAGVIPADISAIMIYLKKENI